MTKMMSFSVAAWLAAVWLFPTVVRASDDSRSGCEPDKVAVIRCDTDSDGGVKVRNSSVTSATGVTIQRGDRCAAAVASLLRAGLRLSHRPKVTTSSSMTDEVSFNFVFLDCYDDDDSDDDDDDDDDHDDDDDDDDS